MVKAPLLPAGIYDSLYPDAGMHRAACTQLIKRFESFGYRYVSPPLIEFEEGLLSGSAMGLAKNTFRLMDPSSQQMLALRSDITTQIARIATTRIAHSELPVRIGYAGNVLRVKGDALHHERQLTQAGVELIGVEGLEADIEVIRVAIEALSHLGIEKLAIDFSLPKLKEIILADITLEAPQNSQLEDAIARKDPKIIKALGAKQSNLLLALCAPAITLKEFLALSLPRAAKPLVKQLKELMALVEAHFPDLHVTIDPLEARHGGYHSGVAFALFARGAKGEIGRGGRYYIPTRKENGEKCAIDAVGCSLYVNMLKPLLKPLKEGKRVFIPQGTDEAAAHQLRQEGYITIYATGKAKNVKAEAKRLSCDAIYEGTKIVTL